MTKIEKRMVVEYGIELDGVWLPLAMLRRLDERGPWTAPLTEATTEQVGVLVAHGLAERHNSGLCRGHALRNFIEAFPFEPTLPFGKIAAPGSDEPAGDRRGDR